MTSGPLEAYLKRLEHELTKLGLMDARIVDEVREHLVDAIEDGLRRGSPMDAAEREAFARLGEPETVAGHFATERHRMLNRLPSILAGLAGLMRGREPAARACRFHDVRSPSAYHFAVRLKRRIRNRFAKMSPDEQEQFIADMKQQGSDVSADPRENLLQFLGRFGPRTLGPMATVDSLTLIEDTTDSRKRGGRYLATFANGATMIWTVAQTSDGAIDFDGASVP
jgi:hypothetical protein